MKRRPASEVRAAAQRRLSTDKPIEKVTVRVASLHMESCKGYTPYNRKHEEISVAKVAFAARQALDRPARIAALADAAPKSERSITAQAMGDPMPGRSALDQRGLS